MNLETVSGWMSLLLHHWITGASGMGGWGSEPTPPLIPKLVEL